jgi:photosystem II stability/assembly factor-like uncharacterized protein
VYVLFSAISVHAQWVDMLFPASGSVRALASKDSILFASASEGRVLITNKNTKQWTEPTSNLTSKLVNTFLVDGDNIFAGTASNGLFRSTDNGTTWNTLGLSASVYAVSKYDSTIYVSSGNGLHTSTDNGLTWARINSYKNVKGTLLHRERLFCISAEAGLFISDDSGKTWKTPTNSVGSTTLAAIIEHQNDIYISTYGAGVFRSSDDGESWNSVNIGLSNFDVLALESNDDVIFGGTYGGGVFASNNKGNVWVPVNTGVTDFHVYSFAKDDSTLFMATGNSGVWRRPLRQFVNLKSIVYTPQSHAFNMSCFPNPFNTSATIGYKLDNSDEVLVEVYDVLGRKIQTLVDGTVAAGEQSVRFSTGTLPEGIYYAKLKTSSAQSQIKMVLSK